MSDMVKLTMEVEVPKDQLPEGYTGRLVCRTPTNDDCTIVITADGVAVMKLFAGVECSSPRIIVEVRQPWRVPDYLRDKRFNGWTIRGATNCVYIAMPDGVYATFSYHSRLALHLLGGEWQDFADMEVDNVYKIGEDAE